MPISRRTLTHAVLATVTVNFTGAIGARSKPVARPDDLKGRWGDQGDGTFVNPVLPADYSDIDVIRVSDDYYAISSTIHVSPGVVVLHSRDLVNWRTISHAVADIDVLGPEVSWRNMAGYGRGVWAGAIRYHAGKFWIYFTCPDSGIYLTTATSPAGPWAPLARVWDMKGYDDTCPFWDDDGQGYLVTSHFAADPATGRKYDIHLFKLSADGTSLDLASDRIIHQSPGSEANKLYKIDGVYYHYYSEVKPEGRVAMMNRSKSLEGPWETRQLNHVDKAVDKEPNQGGLVQAPSGDWWFLTHQGTGDWEGRALCLLPVKWQDGWPVLGQPGDDGIGNMVWQAQKPIAGQPRLMPDLSDDFSKATLGQHWEWNHAPRADMWSLAERRGALRLHAFTPVKGGDLTSVGNVLSQRAWRTAANAVTVRFDLSGMADGQSAGLNHASRTFAVLGVEQTGATRRLVFRDSSGNAVAGPKLTRASLWLRSAWDVDGNCLFAYSLDGRKFTAFGPTCKLAWGRYRGDRIGLHSFNAHTDAGYVDILQFDYTVADQTGQKT